ncbi:hypothetical protein AOQ84DRAFT_417442, partial [Glonium stellatum]
VFNKALNKNISVYLSESGDGYKRLTGAIGAGVKSAALSKVKERFENGSLFKEEGMKLMERVTVTNMSHQSEGDQNAHYSVQGETDAGSKVKGGHVPEDAFKQAVSQRPISHEQAANLIYSKPAKQLLFESAKPYLLSSA